MARLSEREVREIANGHTHRKPTKRDWEGKTVKRFRRDADNVWRFEFTDGTKFAIQCELFGNQIPAMELCDVCG